MRAGRGRPPCHAAVESIPLPASEIAGSRSRAASPTAQSQRAAIARALANEPALILADEPTGNLDSKISGEIMALFEELHDAGATLVIITHDTEIARGAPRRIALRDGRVESDVKNGENGS